MIRKYFATLELLIYSENCLNLEHWRLEKKSGIKFQLIESNSLQILEMIIRKTLQNK